MNREIKFRAWDASEKVMCKVLMLWPGDNEHGVQLLKPDGNLTLSTTAQQNEISIMQFIGLKDKNRKDIYEGDIVQTPASKSVVEFDKGLFGLNHDYGTDNKSMLGAWGSECNLRCLYDGYHREIEVIGNLYENPELLNK